MNIVAIGEVLWDCFPDEKYLGGAAANFTYHASKLGANALLISAIGADELGMEIRQALEKQQIANLLYVHQSQPTSTVDITLDDSGLPSYTINQPVAWDFLALTPEMQLPVARADVLYFGSLVLRSAENRNLLADIIARKASQTRVFVDVNLRQSFFDNESLSFIIKHADFIKINDDELPKLCCLCGIENDVEVLFSYLNQHYNTEMLIYTRGSKGSLLLTANEKDLHSGINIRAIDTVGAGDSFSATAIVLALQHKPLAMINHFANSIAAFVCTQRGAMPEVPYVMVENYRGLK